MKSLRIAAFFLLCCSSSAGADESESLLRGLSGVGLQIRPLNIQSKTFELDENKLEAYVIQRMQELHIPLHSQSEVEALPGKPFLELVANITHAQGPSHIYSITLELRELAELERPQDSVVVMAVGTWKREMLGVANRPEAIFQIVDRLLRLFSNELRGMNIPK